MKRNRVRPRLRVTTGGRGVVNHAGARLLCDLAEATGLADGLSAVMAGTKQRRRGHDRGEVLVDLAVMLADDGKTISDLRTLRNQPALFGEVASTPTAWRTLGAVDEAVLAAIGRARAKARAAAWAAGMDPGFYVLDFDGTLVNSHSEKDGAAPTYKRGFGFHPLLVYLDATGEALAGKLRPGNAGSNTTADHVEVLDAALEQLPVDPHEVEVVARADSGALSHGFVGACRDRGVRFAIGYDLTETVRAAVLAVPKRRWVPAVAADGIEERDGAEVAEITDLLDLSSWPAGTRAIVRREDPHPGAQLTFTDIDGHRFLVFITDLPDPDIAYLEALHRGRAAGPNSGSGTPRPPACATCRRKASPSTPPGSPRCLSPRTSWPGPNTSASTANSPEPNPNGSATACSTPPASSPAADGAPRSASPTAGPGPNNSPPPSTGSEPCRSLPERSRPSDQRRSNAPAYTRNTRRGTPTARRPASAARTITGNTDNNAAERRSHGRRSPY